MELSKGTLLEKLGEKHQEDAAKLKDAYINGKSSPFYQLARENSWKKNSSRKVRNILADHDIDTSIVLLAECQLLWISKKDRAHLLHKAASIGYTPFCQLLLEIKAFPVDALDKQCSTPLHLSAVEGHVETCKLLMHYGAQVDALNSALRTPAQETILFGHIKKIQNLRKVLTLLRQHGAQMCLAVLDSIVLHTDHDSMNERLRIAFIFGAQLETQDDLGKTIMHRLVEHTTEQCSNKYEDYHDNIQKNTQVADILHTMVIEYQKYLESQRGVILLALQRFRKNSLLGKVPRDVLISFILPHILHGKYKNTQGHFQQLELLRSLLFNLRY